MSTAMVADPTTVAPDQRVVLRRVSWDTYERLLADRRDCGAPRLTFDRGVLEIVSPSTGHEERNRALASLVETVAVETLVEFRDVGGMTYARRDIERGFEPDSSFYIQNEERVSDRPQIDLSVDPPPDLVIEIDVTRSSLDKLALFARFGVPEVWRDTGDRVAIMLLRADGKGYVEGAASAALPGVTAGDLNRLVRQLAVTKRGAWTRQVRAWARTLGATGGVTP